MPVMDRGAGGHPDQGADEKADVQGASHEGYQNPNVRI
jgi:hypothetical protein